MTKFLTILVLSTSLTGCLLDNKRQRDLFLPVTLEIYNATQEDFHSGLIYGTPESSGGFSIPITKISSGTTSQEKVTDTVYYDVKAEQFVFDGTCGSNSKWKSNRSNTQKKFVDNPEEWKIEIRIVSCQ